MIRRAAGWPLRFLRAIGREIAATIRWGGPRVAVSSQGDDYSRSDSAPISVVVGLTALEASLEDQKAQDKSHRT